MKFPSKQTQHPSNRKSTIGLLLTVMLLFGLTTTANAQTILFDKLLQNLPDSTNAIVAIDVEGVLKSPIAVKEGWAYSFKKKNASTPLILPPESDKLVIASNLDTNDGFSQNWELAVIRLTEDIPMKAIARAEGGRIDKINNKEAAWTPSDAYFVDLDYRLLGTMYPANRKAVSRWTKFTSRKNKEIVIEKFLVDAAQSVNEKGPQVVMALDLKDVPEPHRLEEGLMSSRTLGDKELVVKRLMPKILGIQGIKLDVYLRGKATGKIIIEFNDNAEDFGKFAKPLILESMDKFGVRISQFEEWNTVLDGNKITLEGPLSETSLRRIFSLLEIPSTKFSSLKGSETSKSSEELMAENSRQYFKSVEVLIEDLRKTLKENQHAHSTFFERYGRKIDRLPILNVDDQLLDWGSSVAETFRTISLSKRKAGVDAGVQNAGVSDGTYRNNGSYNNYRYGSYNSYTKSSSTRIQNKMTANSKATNVRLNSWKDIDDSTAKIRREMTKKYNVEF